MRRRELEELGEEYAKRRGQQGQHEAKCHKVFSVWRPGMFFPLLPCDRGSSSWHKCRQVEILFLSFELSLCHGYLVACSPPHQSWPLGPPLIFMQTLLGSHSHSPCACGRTGAHRRCLARQAILLWTTLPRPWGIQTWPFWIGTRTWAQSTDFYSPHPTVFRMD